MRIALCMALVWSLSAVAEAQMMVLKKQGHYALIA